jgi:hypothetical protein
LQFSTNFESGHAAHVTQGMVAMTIPSASAIAGHLHQRRIRSKGEAL